MSQQSTTPIPDAEIFGDRRPSQPLTEDKATSSEPASPKKAAKKPSKQAKEPSKSGSPEKKKAPRSPKPKPEPKPKLVRPPPPSFKNSRAWIVEPSLEELREACGQEVKLVHLDACDPDTCERVHVMLVEPVHQDRYHREAGDLLCRIHRPTATKANALIPAEPDEQANCEYCLRKPPRIERRRQAQAFKKAHSAPPKPKKAKKEKAQKKRKDKVNPEVTKEVQK